MDRRGSYGSGRVIAGVRVKLTTPARVVDPVTGQQIVGIITGMEVCDKKRIDTVIF
jgi:hypothetical protein